MKPHRLARRRPAGQLRAVTTLLTIVVVIVTLYSAVFHVFMAREGQSHSWLTGVYWTVQTMTTLGFGDVTFTSDAGRVFSMVVLATGVILLFILLPFTLIQLLYAPWLEARNAARTPQALPAGTSGHVILTGYGPVEEALIQRLDQFRLAHVVIVPDAARALALHDRGVQVMVGRLDDPETYRRACVDRAALVATTLPDPTNAHVVLTVREASERVPIVATATWEASVELLKRAGCQQVIQLGEMLGREIARRIAGHGGRPHVVGQLDDLLIAEAAAAGTSLVGQTRARVAAARTAERQRPGRLAPRPLLCGRQRRPAHRGDDVLLSGTRADLDNYDREMRTRDVPPVAAVVIGGGRVGRAASRNLSAAGIDHRVIEKLTDRVQDWSRYVIGDATDPEILNAAGLDRATSVAITTHDDDVNVYLTLYCRRMRPDMQILSRATVEQAVASLHRAGADLVLSYVPMEANAIFDIVRRGSLLLLAEGLEVFTVAVPGVLVGKPIAECRLREETGCNVLAVRRPGGAAAPPDLAVPLAAGVELILIGDRDDERRYFERYPVQASRG